MFGSDPQVIKITLLTFNHSLSALKEKIGNLNDKLKVLTNKNEQMESNMKSKIKMENSKLNDIEKKMEEMSALNETLQSKNITIKRKLSHQALKTIQLEEKIKCLKRDKQISYHQKQSMNTHSEITKG